MADIEILTEEELKNAWGFEVALYEGGKAHQFKVTLAWADYDLWCHGRVGPSKVVLACFDFLLKNEPANAIMREFDCAIIRRYFPEIDKELPGMI